MDEKAQTLFGERLARVETAIHLGTPDRVPIAPMIDSYQQRANGSCYADLFYNHEKAGEAAVKFYKEHPLLDTATFAGFQSGLSNEIAQSRMMDWPGSPTGKIDKHSTYQVIELEVMTQDEYPELINDFTGFMLRKYFPRVYPALKGLSGLNINPSNILGTAALAPLYSPEITQAYEILVKIGEENAKAGQLTGKYMGLIAELGFPPALTGFSEAPYDILGDFFRGTMGIFEDLTDEGMYEYIDAACEMFAQQQIAQLQYFRFADMPVKRVFFPLHKAMDGFMNDGQFERFYWKPLKKIMMALIDMGVTPFIYSEGPYNSRLEMLTDVPHGKVLYHFEKVDIRRAKEMFSGIACISGNLSATGAEFGRKEDIVRQTRELLDICMPGGGWIFDFDASVINTKEENLEAVLETLDKYGRY